MNVEVKSDATRVSELVHLGDKTTVLWCVTGRLSLVGLRARVCGSATGSRPLVWPVPVDVSSHTGVAADCLTVLAPETVCSLAVDKAIRVDNRGDIEVCKSRKSVMSYIWSNIVNSPNLSTRALIEASEAYFVSSCHAKYSLVMDVIHSRACTFP